MEAVVSMSVQDQNHVRDRAAGATAGLLAYFQPLLRAIGATLAVGAVCAAAVLLLVVLFRAN